jgi:hypothetical protein
MNRNLGEFPKFFVVNSGTESDWNSTVFAISLLLFALLQFSAFTFPS